MPQFNQPTLATSVAEDDILLFWLDSAGALRTIKFSDFVNSVSGIISKNDAVANVSSNTTLDDTYEFVVANSGGTFTITLPDSTAYEGKRFKIANKGAGVVTIQRTGSDVIATGSASASSVTAAQWTTYEFESDGDGVWFRS